MFSKKGVSDIVTTVLIILLVLAAVSIVGNIILKNLQKGGAEIQTSTECLSLDVQPLACNKLSANNYSIQYKWVKGSDVALDSVKVFVYDDRGLNVIADGVKPQFLGVKEAIVNTTSLAGNESYASVAGVIVSETGAKTPCSESNIKITCEAS